jgi:hypothetical protein
MVTRVEGGWRHRGGFFLRTDVAARYKRIAIILSSILKHGTGLSSGGWWKDGRFDAYLRAVHDRSVVSFSIL